jgi:hypothetical protein
MHHNLRLSHSTAHEGGEVRGGRRGRGYHQIQEPIDNLVIRAKDSIHLDDGVGGRETSNLVDCFVRDEIQDVHRELTKEHLRRSPSW